MKSLVIINSYFPHLGGTIYTHSLMSGTGYSAPMGDVRRRRRGTLLSVQENRATTDETPHVHEGRAADLTI